MASGSSLDPRGYIRNVNVGALALAVQVDSTINVPGIQTPGPGPGVSTSVGLAVTWVGNSTYSSDNDQMVVGLGNSGDPMIGVLLHVDPDGMGSIYYKGIVEAIPSASNPPLLNLTVAVDGAGKVIAASPTAAKNANARCIGFDKSVNQAIYVHQQGNISPPTTNVQQGSVEYCQVELL